MEKMNFDDLMKFAIPEITRGNCSSVFYLNKLERMSQMQQKDIELLVNRKRAELLQYAKKYVPFYKRSLAGIGDIEEVSSSADHWCSIPLVDRNTVTPHEEDFISSIVENRVWKDTSGSTGRKFRFLTDRNQSHWAEASTAFVRKKITGKYVPAETVLWGAPRDRTPEGKLKSRLKFAFRNYNQIIAYNPDEKYMRAVVDELLITKPELLLGYPNLLLLLIEQDREKTLSRIPWIMTAGEWLRDDVRAKLEQHFGSKVFDFYGCREMGSIAFECSEHNGLHIISPMVFLEIVNTDGSVCREKEVGEIVLTSLVRRSMPFIRYRIGDMGSIDSEPCSCGCPFPKLQALSGRTMDVLYLPKGIPITANFWTFLSREIEGIKQFRVIQNELGRITMELVPESSDKDLDESLVKKIRDEVCHRLGYQLQMDVSFVDRLPVNQSGKTGLVVSHFRKNQ